jgi:hypothetical protein
MFTFTIITSDVQGRQFKALCQAHQTAYGNVHLKSCSQDLILCPADRITWGWVSVQAIGLLKRVLNYIVCHVQVQAIWIVQAV